MNNFFDSILNYLGYESFTKWFLSEGVWAIALIIVIFFIWFIFHKFARPKISSLATKLKNREEKNKLEKRPQNYSFYSSISES